MHLRCPITRAALLCPPLLLIAGCLSTKSPEKTDRGTISFWEPHRLFLNRVPHDSLYVEVDAVEGAEPSDAVLKALEEFLRLHCDKPGGVTVVRDDVVPRTAAVGYHHDALALQYLDGPTGTNSSSAFIYVLYFDSNLVPDPGVPTKAVHKHLGLKAASRYVKPENPHVHLLPYASAIYVDRRYLKTCAPGFEPLALCHEVGHILGLTTNKDHASERHCHSEGCLMNAYLKVHFGKWLLGKYPFTQTNLCDKCLADLRGTRRDSATNNLKFLGPMIVRSEQDYHVISLPSETKLFTGDLSSFNTSKFIEQVRSDGKGGKGRFTARVWADFGEQSSELETQIRRLSPVKTDPDPFVRHATTQLVMRAQSALGRHYLTNSSSAPEQAMTWVRDAAEAGDTDSQKFLAGCYLNGIGVERDELEAYKWFALAARQGNKSATEQRDALLKKFTTAQIAEARRRFDAAHTKP